MMTTIRQGIYELLGSVEITTKELGKTHVEPWPSQRLVIDGICRGLNEGVHEFVILKCRQVAITTVCGVIELFWALTNPGVQGAIIADRGDNLERLRRIFADLLESLPPEWRGPDHRLVTNNRTGMTFANRSTIDLLAAGSNPDLGASRALNMVHATECSLWRSLSGVESLRAALARENPNRLYVFESIANGLNWFYHYWREAKLDTRHKRAIFCGFWSNPTYRIAKTDPDFKVYWDGGTLTDSEIKRALYVKQNYDYTVKPEQIAWWRRESEYRAEEYVLRNYPWTEDECFIASGSGFFPAQRTMALAQAMGDGIPYKGFRYVFADEFLDSRIEQVTERDDVTLRVWEPPDPAGFYAIGVDPSGGGTAEADDHAVQVFRCYADRFVQVAEFQSSRPLTYQLAWVLAHLCGAYKTHICNIEVTGVGAAVLPEVRNLRILAERGILQAEPGSGPILDMIGCVRWFLYKRPDTLGGGGNVIAWKTNFDNKNQIYSELRDSLMKERSCLEIRSSALLAQMQGIVYDDGSIGAGNDTGEKDDLVTALVLCHHVWIATWRDVLTSRGLTFDRVHAEPPVGSDQDALHKGLSLAYSRKMQSIYSKGRERRDRF